MRFRSALFQLTMLCSQLHLCPARGEISADPNGAAMMQSAQQAIADFHQGAEHSEKAIRVVYFYPSDREPLEQWSERLQRILCDIEEFYAEGFRRFQLDDAAIRFEQEDDEYRVHLVKGRLPLDEYSYESGRAIRRELAQALRDEIDFQRSYVLAIHGLCRRDAEGKFVFSAPYYGNGTPLNGLCHAVDCPLLDPQFLTERNEHIVYAEHYYRKREQTVGLFNSWYLGGIAHELGHGLALPHDAGRPWEREQQGVSLMGGGNHHYRSHLHGGRTPTYLSLASTLRLLSHPIITQSDRGRYTPVESRLASLEFSLDDGRLNIAGDVQSKVPAYAVVTYLWRPRSWPGNPGNDHQSITYPALVEDGGFRQSIGPQKPGDYRLRLAVLHANGASRKYDFHLKVDQTGQPNVAELNGDWLITRVETAVLRGDPIAARLTDEDSIAAAPTPEVAAKLRVLSEVLVPPEPLDLASTTKNSVYLSDAQWISAKVGWRHVARNYYDLRKANRNNIFLELDGKFYEKGFYAHAASKYEFDLAQRWKTFTATIGLRDGAADQGSAVFTVLGDGKQLYESRILRVGDSEEVKVDVSNVERLKLRTRGGEGHINHCWSIWCEPKLER